MVEHVLHEFENSNDLIHDLPRLKNRLLEKGYVFFRELLDKEALLQIRGDFLELADKHGFVKKGTNLMDGIFVGGTFPDAHKFGTSKLYREILDLQTFNSFPQAPLIKLLFSGLINGELQEHRRRIGRITFPQSFENTTPPHQDFFYIRGTKDTYTSWIPCGDCPQELGGLAVLEGSNHLGFLEHEKMSGTGGHGVPEKSYHSSGLRWLGTDFKLGDILIFNSLTIHKALHNLTADQMRISVEYRFQRKDEEINPRSMKTHMEGAFKE